MGVQDYDIELYEAIEDLVAEGTIDQGMPAYGISQKVIHEGYDALTEKQRFVYDRDILPALKEQAEEMKIVQIKNSWPE